jgi:hypothetical protein
MKFLLLNFLAFATISGSALAAPGEGGMSECISLSTQVALNRYYKDYSTNSIPTVEVGKSDGSPSNGLDLMVTVNKEIIYYMIATVNSEVDSRGVPVQLRGCTNAFIGRTVKLW